MALIPCVFPKLETPLNEIFDGALSHVKVSWFFSSEKGPPLKPYPLPNPSIPARCPTRRQPPFVVSNTKLFGMQEKRFTVRRFFLTFPDGDISN